MSKQPASKSGANRRRRSNGAPAEAATDTTTSPRPAGTGGHPHRKADLFTRLAQGAARLSGRSSTFLIALALILIWAASGPLFGFSDTWQLVVNTATTIITFLMVFLIQNTQNRDTLALQIKLADLIIAMRGAHNNLAAAEDLSEAELEALHEEYRCRADATLASLEHRRTNREHG